MNKLKRKTVSLYRLRFLMTTKPGPEERLQKNPDAVILMDADGVCNNEKYYDDVLNNKKLFNNFKMTAGNKEVYEKFKNAGFKCFHLCEVSFRPYKIRNSEKREGILNIAPARNEHDPSRRTREVFGHQIIEYGRIKDKIFDVMAQSKIGVINGRNNTTLSFFDALACGLPVLLPNDIRICPEYLLTDYNHYIYKDKESFDKGIDKLSKVNHKKIIDDFLENNKKHIEEWNKVLNVSKEETLHLIRL